jgi:hypothetical protein
MRPVSYLLRIVLPDRPGSLGAVATALGAAGADILGVEVVEHRPDGRAVDDFLLELEAGRLPDGLVSACQSLDGVEVDFVGRYAAGANLHRDLEAIEAMTMEPHRAEEVLVELVPGVFPASWGLLVVRDGDGSARLLAASGGAPTTAGFRPPWLPLDKAMRITADGDWAPPSWHDVVALVAPLDSPDRVVVVGRNGGPETLDSEVARLAHLAALAGTVRKVGRAG